MFFRKKNKITFTSAIGSIAFNPKPSSHFSPEWYKKQPRHFGKPRGVSEVFGEDPNDVGTRWTIKNCIPFRDSMYAGYIIPFPSDVALKCEKDPYTNELGLRVFTPSSDISGSGLEVISDHKEVQFKNHPFITLHEGFYPTHKALKFGSPWIVTTPPGYSCIFQAPQHRESKLEMISGIVDTDTYKSMVQFPAFAKLKEGEETIVRAGDPMIQIIPFKREAWAHDIKDVHNDSKERDQISISQQKVVNVFSNRYKKFFWNKKEYK